MAFGDPQKVDGSTRYIVKVRHTNNEYVSLSWGGAFMTDEAKADTAILDAITALESAGFTTIQQEKQYYVGETPQ